MKKRGKFFKADRHIKSRMTESDMAFIKILDDNSEKIVEHKDVYNSLIELITAGITLNKKLSDDIKDYLGLLGKSTKESEVEYYQCQVEDAVNYKMKCEDKTTEYLYELYEFCESSNRFWHNCSFKTYEDYYPHIIETYLETYDNATKLDCLFFEYKNFIKSKHLKRNFLSVAQKAIDESDDLLHIDYYSILSDVDKEFFEITKQRKLDFLSNEILKLGYYVQIAKKKKNIIIHLIPEKQNDFEKLEENLDIANIPKFNIIERFELLKTLGFDFTKIDSDKKSQNKLLALVLGCSVDNARKLIDETYKVKSREQKNERNEQVQHKINEFFNIQGIKIKI